jgi:hypothetical protein
MSLPPLKTPNVAGSFYPSDGEVLHKCVADFITSGKHEPSQESVRAIIAPHAGYQYSGAVAGTAYRFIRRNPIRTVIIFAPNHFDPFQGIAVWTRGLFRTPIADTSIHSELALQLIDHDSFCVEHPQAFEQEHALEVQLPFIQCLFPTAEIVPVIFGQPTKSILECFAQRLHHSVSHREDVLIVVSSDMSHYLPANQAQKKDKKTIETLFQMDPGVFWQACQTRHIEMCGYAGATALLYWAQLAGLNNMILLDRQHSGQVTGDNSKVVGYSALALLGKNKHAQQ